jgi:hypothetical protein
MRHANRGAGKHESQNRTVKHATGIMDWDTRRFRRDKNWKLYRKTQYKENKKKPPREPKNGEHWRYSTYVPVLPRPRLPFSEQMYHWFRGLQREGKFIGLQLVRRRDYHTVYVSNYFGNWVSFTHEPKRYFYITDVCRDYDPDY